MARYVANIMQNEKVFSSRCTYSVLRKTVPRASPDHRLKAENIAINIDIDINGIVVPASDAQKG